MNYAVERPASDEYEVVEADGFNVMQNGALVFYENLSDTLPTERRNVSSYRSDTWLSVNPE